MGCEFCLFVSANAVFRFPKILNNPNPVLPPARASAACEADGLRLRHGRPRHLRRCFEISGRVEEGRRGGIRKEKQYSGMFLLFLNIGSGQTSCTSSFLKELNVRNPKSAPDVLR